MIFPMFKNIVPFLILQNKKFPFPKKFCRLMYSQILYYTLFLLQKSLTKLVRFFFLIVAQAQPIYIL